MVKCRFCQKENNLISKALSCCRACLLDLESEVIESHITTVHNEVRRMEDLTLRPPKSKENDIKIKCKLCFNECELSEGDTSYCGLKVINFKGEKARPFPSASLAYLHGYIDPNPTNCCNAWFCPAGTTSGFPKYSLFEGPEYNTLSYAVFLYGCSFNCLFCQNSSHKHFSNHNLVNVDELALKIFENRKITCICYFGGTPEPQLPFTINLSNKILEHIRNSGEKRVFRACWEWNGTGKRSFTEECMKIAIKTGGNIKFDLKAFNERINLALCGASNKRTLKNFEYLAKKYFGTREKDMPELSACTLLVPSYINHEEVEQIASFIASINEEIPYSLLIFHPDYMMNDLPITPKRQVEKCLESAKKYLKKVNIGNKFLL